MSKCFICNKCICLYIYICLLHFVVNEEKYVLRYNGGELKWDFTLELGSKGGKVFYNRLKEKKI